MVVDVADPAGHPGAVTEPGFAPSDTPLGVDGVETAVFDGEAVLFHEGASMVHRLNAVAGAVWLLCDGETTVASMPDELAEVFGVPAADLSARSARHSTVSPPPACSSARTHRSTCRSCPSHIEPPTAPRSSSHRRTLEAHRTTAPCGRTP